MQTMFNSPPLNLPQDESEESLFDFLKSFHIIGDSDKQIVEITNYLKGDLRRFLYTLQLVRGLPVQNGLLYEIGANPYFTSMLIRKFTQFSHFCMNYFGSSFSKKQEQVLINDDNERFEFIFDCFNIEAEPMPYPDSYFDVILFCEVLEHMWQDPMKALINIKKKVKLGGYLILSTPNPCRLDNLAAVLSGRNIYDPFSGYGPYGRHNREYTRHELYVLLTSLGFEFVISFTADVHDGLKDTLTDEQLRLLGDLVGLHKNREHDLGQYIFIVAKNAKPLSKKIQRPSWLFQSYVDDEIYI